MQLKVKEKTFDLLDASSRDELMSGHRRKVLTLHINGSSYAEMSDILTDGAELTIVDDTGNEYQHVEYSKAGPITDNRDGTYTCKMGYPNTIEQDLQDNLDAANRAITTLAGSLVDADGAQAIREQVETAARYVPEDKALSVPSVFPSWDKALAEGAELPKGFILSLDGRLYITKQAVTPQAHQPPDGEGMLAVYRPIDQSHAGTKDDPVPWVYGMDCFGDKYYSYNGNTYLCKSDMLPCVWAPDTAGLWQWELQI